MKRLPKKGFYLKFLSTLILVGVVLSTFAPLQTPAEAQSNSNSESTGYTSLAESSEAQIKQDFLLRYRDWSAKERQAFISTSLLKEIQDDFGKLPATEQETVAAEAYYALRTIKSLSTLQKEELITQFSVADQKHIATLTASNQDLYLAGHCFGITHRFGFGTGCSVVRTIVPGVATASDFFNSIRGVISGGCRLTLNGIRECFKDLAVAFAQVILDQIARVYNGMYFLMLRGMIYMLELVGLIFGFDLHELIESVSCFSPIKSFLGTGFIDLITGEITEGPKSNYIVSIFTVADIGISQVYQAIPSENPGQYLARTFNDNILGIRPAFAQGEGTSSLTSFVQDVWSKMRDLALIFMVIVMIVLGFMIMFRKRLNPQTSVTVLNSIPRVALTLVLITFSFAISGLFIDMAYIGVNLVRSYFGSLSWYVEIFNFTSEKLGGEIILFPIFASLSGGSVFSWGAILNVLCGSLGAVGLPAALGLMGVIGLLELLLRLILFGVAIYLFWVLLRTFTLMVVYTIFSPFFFLLGAIPGFEGTAISWVKRMIASALSFPIIVVFIYLAIGFLFASNPIISLFTSAGGPENIQAPPPLSTNLLNIPALIGYGLIFFATKVPKVIERMFKIDDFDIRGGVGAGILLAPVAAPLAAAQTLGNLGRAYDSSGRLLERYGASGLPLHGLVDSASKKLYGKMPDKRTTEEERPAPGRGAGPYATTTPAGPTPPDTGGPGTPGTVIPGRRPGRTMIRRDRGTPPDTDSGPSGPAGPTGPTGPTGPAAPPTPPSSPPKRPIGKPPGSGTGTT